MSRCKKCKEKFEPRFFLQKFCLNKDECIKSHVDYSKELIENKWKVKKKALKETLKTNKDYLKELQTVFNTFIRVRDKDKGCISCGNSFNSKFDAGHFYSVGSSPSIRFNEDNVHGQCVHCNQHLHGNIHVYTERLPERIGKESFEELKTLRQSVNKYTIPELKELKEIYKQKVKGLESKI